MVAIAPAERTAQAYGPGVTSASRSVLVELMTLLRAYREALVLVGGWVPYLLLEQHQRPEDAFVHVGSIDIDLAVDPAAVQEAQYASIVQLLLDRGYRRASDRRGAVLPDSFERTVPSPKTSKAYTIRVDFLTPLNAADPERAKHAAVHDGLMARKIRGCDAAFRYHTSIDLSGTLPHGGRMTVPMRMATLVGCVAMKGIVLGERYREKDAYDLYALMAHYGRGPAEVAEALRPHQHDPLVREAIDSIRTAFQRRESNGPAWAAGFTAPPMLTREYERLVTDAFMVVGEFLRLLPGA